MMKIELFELGEVVEIEEDKIESYETSCGDVYETAYQLDDGRWVAYNEAVNAWVMLG